MWPFPARGAAGQFCAGLDVKGLVFRALGLSDLPGIADGQVYNNNSGTDFVAPTATYAVRLGQSGTHDGSLTIASAIPGSGVQALVNLGAQFTQNYGFPITAPSAAGQGLIYKQTTSFSYELGWQDKLLLLPISTPSAPASGFLVYTDTADGRLKAISSAGTVTSLALP